MILVKDLLAARHAIETLGNTRVSKDTALALAPMVEVLYKAIEDHEDRRTKEWKKRGLQKPCGCWFFKKYRMKKKREKFEREVAHFVDMEVTLPPAVDLSLLPDLRLQTNHLLSLTKLGAIRG